jgi:hypothetical protein
MRIAVLLMLPLAVTSAQQAEVQRYCTPCHNDRLKTAGLSLAHLDLAQHSATAEKVLRRLRARQMPPAGLPRPDEATYRRLVGEFESAMDLAAAKSPDPGSVPGVRRLTRFEYQNAVRDLLRVQIDAATLLPPDETSGGFDNITTASLSPTLLERYLTAARKVSRLAIGITPSGVNGDTFTLPPDRTQEKHFDRLPLGTRGGMAVSYNFPVDGEYEIILRLARDRNEHVEGFYGGSSTEHDLVLLLNGKTVKTFTARRPKAGEDFSVVDRDFRVRIPVTGGMQSLQAAFPDRSRDLQETERQPYSAFFNMDRHPRPRPALYSLTINGPYAPSGAGKTTSRIAILAPCAQTPGVSEDACAAKIVATLARRAFRRPLDAREVENLLRFYRNTRQDGGTFDEGVEMSLRAILVSPAFLLRIERSKEAHLSPLELASRLSFFLWSSIPDEELLAAAESGALRAPKELERQVRRMWQDQRSEALVKHFAGQWLQLQNLASSNPDMRLFTDFDDNLRIAFREETERFVDAVWRADRPLTELIRANYTFLNERLAKHYGVPNVYGSHYRRVEFPDASRTRGGLLRQGSFLTVTSYATRTSPVIRGKWVLDNILGIPPPPPPPDVPALKERAQTGKVLTVRERLTEHRANAVCAGCHQLMDPIGFAFESYDAIGRRRRHDDFLPIDSTGKMFDGTAFNGVDEIEKAILARPEVFATTFTEKLLTYALARPVDHQDAPAIRRIVREAGNGGFSSYIVGIAKSLPFTSRRSP